MSGVAGFPRCRCDAGGPHNAKDIMNGLQNLMWEHFELFIDYDIWTWISVVARNVDALNQSTVIKVLGWNHSLCLNTWDSSFAICDWRMMKGSGKG